LADFVKTGLIYPQNNYKCWLSVNFRLAHLNVLVY